MWKNFLFRVLKNSLKIFLKFFLKSFARQRKRIEKFYMVVRGNWISIEIERARTKKPVFTLNPWVYFLNFFWFFRKHFLKAPAQPVTLAFNEIFVKWLQHVKKCDGKSQIWNRCPEQFQKSLCSKSADGQLIFLHKFSKMKNPFFVLVLGICWRRNFFPRCARSYNNRKWT